eukprot:UN09055
MPIDLAYFRGEEEGKVLATSQTARFDKRTINVDKLINPESTSEVEVSFVDAIKALDALWRENQYKLEQGRKEINALGKEIAQKAKAKEPIDELKAKSIELKAALVDYERLAKLGETERNKLMARVGNIVHPTVPIDTDEDNNEVVRTWLPPGQTALQVNNGELLHHHHLLEMIDGYKSEAGVNVAGHRGYFLHEAGLMLNQALIRYGLSYLRKNNTNLFNHHSQ